VILSDEKQDSVTDYPSISFGSNLTIEEEKVEFPNGKDNIKAYTVS
jgi:hypothetical protein